MSKPRIRQNVWGNWNAYIGREHFKEFGTDEIGARDWLANMRATPVAAALKALLDLHGKDSEGRLLIRWFSDRDIENRAKAGRKALKEFLE